MQLEQFKLDQSLLKHFSKEALGAVASRIHPSGDCVACGRQLQVADQVALSVEDAESVVVFNAMHAACGPGGYREANSINLRHATYRTLSVVLPTRTPDGSMRMQPIALVNTAIDQVTSNRDPKTGLLDLLDSDRGKSLMGYEQAPKIHIDNPGKVGTYRQTGKDVITISTLMGSYDVNASPEFMAFAPDWGGIFVGLVDTVLVEDIERDLRSSKSLLQLGHAITRGDLWMGLATPA